MKMIERNVPCNGCYACCKKDSIFLHPELGDKESDYQTEIFMARVILKQKDDGSCFYLDRKTGCTIHGNAPAICREFDCRKIYKKIKYKPEILAHMSPEIIRAVKRLNKKKLRG
jgi:Fe-S-cluster containining protein